MTAPNALLEAALAYAARGCPVLPLWWPDGKGCGCGTTGCARAGKHPIGTLVPSGLKNATTDEATVRAWWARHPNANIGIATGERSGWLVLDVDGEVGAATLEQLERQHGKLPETPQSLTGGGRHVILRHVAGLKNAVRFAPGLDVRTEGGYIVAPRSRHACGRDYCWDVEHHIDDLAPAVAPDWLLAAMRAEPPPAAAGTDGDIPEGERRSRLLSMAGAMRRRGMSETAILAALRAENAARCKPPLADAEVVGLARAAGKFTAGEEPAPAPVEAEAQTDWPASLRPEAFHGVVGELVHLIAPHSEADPAALLFQLVLAIGSAVGRGPHFVVEADRHGTNLFAVLVGESSKGRKGTSLGQVKRVMAMVDAEWASARIKSGLSSGEGLIYAVRDPVEKKSPVRKGGRIVDYEMCIEDEGVTDKRLFISESEFALVLRVLARDGNTLSAIIRNAWENGNLSTLTKNVPTRATDAHISILGHVTKDELLRYLEDTETANGFGNRFLWICVKRSRLLPDGGSLDPEVLRPFASRIAAALVRAKGDKQLGFTPAARLLWHRIYSVLAADRPGLLGSMTARAEPQVLRLALIYAILDQSEQIDVPHLLAGLAAWKYCDESAAYVFGTALGDPTADTILRTLRASPEGLTRTEICDLFKRHKGRDDTGRALGLLLRHGLAKRTNEPTTGRPIERWRAMPRTAREAKDARKGSGEDPLNSLDSLFSRPEQPHDPSADSAAGRFEEGVA